jgi:hypothetical protein
MSNTFPLEGPGFRIGARVALELVAFLFILKARGFGAMRTRVARCPVASQCVDAARLPALTMLVDRACMYSPWSTRCLARAAIATRLLRSLGFPVTMVTGVQRLPFNAHAWVELNGEPIYGLADKHVKYLEIDRV